MCSVRKLKTERSPPGFWRWQVLDAYAMLDAVRNRAGRADGRHFDLRFVLWLNSLLRNNGFLFATVLNNRFQSGIDFRR